MSADNCFLFGLGFVAVVGAYLLARHMFAARITITDSEMRVSRWIGAKSFLFDDIADLTLRVRRIIPKRHTGGSPVSMHALAFDIEVLVITQRNGTTHEVTLPEFRGNAELLQVLQDRTGRTLQRINSYEQPSCDAGNLR